MHRRCGFTRSCKTIFENDVFDCHTGLCVTRTVCLSQQKMFGIACCLPIFEINDLLYLLPGWVLRGIKRKIFIVFYTFCYRRKKSFAVDLPLPRSFCSGGEQTRSVSFVFTERKFPRRIIPKQMVCYRVAKFARKSIYVRI